MVALARFVQVWKSERFEVSIGKPDREGLGLREVSGTAMTVSGVVRQSRAYSQFEKRCPAATWGFPLPPKSHSKSQPDPTSKLDEFLWRFAEAEIAAPTPHVGG